MKKRKGYNRSVFRSLAVITQFGINMLVPVSLCSLGGIYLDRKLGTSYLMILLFFIGALAGFRNIYILAKRIYMDKGNESGDQKHE